MMTKKESWFECNREEILWNIINSFLAGLLVFFGAFTTGNISKTSIIIALMTAFIVIITKFKDYWLTQEREIKTLEYKQTIGLFNFF